MRRYNGRWAPHPLYLAVLLIGTVFFARAWGDGFYLQAVVGGGAAIIAGVVGLLRQR